MRKDTPIPDFDSVDVDVEPPERLRSWYQVIAEDPRTRVLLRDLRSLRTEKTVVLALLVQLVIAGFSSFLVVGVVSMYQVGGAQTNVAVTGDAAGEVLKLDQPGDNLDYNLYLSKDIAMDALEKGDVNGVLVVDSASDSPRITTTLYVPEGQLQTTVTVTQVTRTLERLERKTRIAHQGELSTKLLSFPEEGNPDTTYTFTYTKLLPLLMMIPVFLAGSIVVDMLAEERASGTFEVLRTTPLTLSDLVLSKSAVAGVFGASQIALWLGLLTFNGFPIHSPLAIISMTLGLSLGAAAIGLFIVLVIPERRYAQSIYSGVLLAGVVALAVLPQHPVNTVARLAIGGSSLVTTLLAVAVYLGGVAVTFGTAKLSATLFKYTTA